MQPEVQESGVVVATYIEVCQLIRLATVWFADSAPDVTDGHPARPPGHPADFASPQG